jgi:uncharacterized protein (DUF4415 family)
MRKLSRLTTAQASNLKRLASMPDSEIDTSDIPEWTQTDFEHSVPFSSLYKPRKLQITTRIDADVVQWLKSSGTRYQSRLNRILRQAMEASNARVESPSRRSAGSGKTVRKKVSKKGRR